MAIWSLRGRLDYTINWIAGFLADLQSRSACHILDVWKDWAQQRVILRDQLLSVLAYRQFSVVSSSFQRFR